jgi:hypothetical protein
VQLAAFVVAGDLLVQRFDNICACSAELIPSSRAICSFAVSSPAVGLPAFVAAAMKWRSRPSSGCKPCRVIETMLTVRPTNHGL